MEILRGDGFAGLEEGHGLLVGWFEVLFDGDLGVGGAGFEDGVGEDFGGGEVQGSDGAAPMFESPHDYGLLLIKILWQGRIGSEHRCDRFRRWGRR